MTYNELVENILAAQEQMLRHSIEANSVILNGRKYGILIENLPPNMKPSIFGMSVKTDYALPDDYDFLVQYEPPQPLTNGDKIRAMTDEELADFINDAEFGFLDRPGICDVCHTHRMKDCLSCWLEWLKQEVRE